MGVTGDGRRYDYVVALRAVETIDFMTVRWVHLPYEFLDLVSRRIVNEVKGISRVVYDITGKPRPVRRLTVSGCRLSHHDHAESRRLVVKTP